MRRALALLAVIAGTSTITVVEPTDMQHMKVDAPSYPLPRTVDDAIVRAMEWLHTHPADIANHELMEAVEEIMFYYALNATAASNTEHQMYQREITRRHNAIASSSVDVLEKHLHLQGDWAPLTYPPLAYIIANSGLESDSYRAIIDDLVSRKRHLDLPRNAMQLWIALYLERLGYAPIPSANFLLGNSTLQQDPETNILLDTFRSKPGSGQDRLATIQLIYNITHEIMALTDFGTLDPPPVMVAQLDHYARLIDEAISWATNEAAIDVLAELIFCAHLLNLKEVPSLPVALNLIINSQQDDGSFGITNPDRSNGKRHGVLTCLLALKTMGNHARTEAHPGL